MEDYCEFDCVESLWLCTEEGLDCERCSRPYQCKWCRNEDCEYRRDSDAEN